MMAASPTASENTTENAYHGMEHAQSQSQQHEKQHQHQQFSCLYTKHKTQKRKVWEDGRLILKGCLAVLHNANPPAGSGDPSLDQCELTRPQINNIRSNLHEGNLETEKFLINVEGPWTQAPASVNLQMTARQPVGAVMTSMKKILTKKYRKPGTYVPPHPMQRAQQEQQQQQQSSLLGKRRHPLQPGELQRRHYGNLPPASQSSNSYSYPELPMNMTQQHQHHGLPPPMHQHQHQQQNQQHGAGGDASSSVNNGEYYAGPPPTPLQSSSQPTSTEPYRQAQVQRQLVSSNPSNREHYQPHRQQQHQQQQQHHNPYHPQQGMHHAAHVQPLRTVQEPNNDNVPRTNVTPPNNYNSTPPQQVPFTNHPETSTSVAPYNQPLFGGNDNGASSGLRPTTAGRLPVTSKEQSSIFATGNGFDPSSFYGEDDLEEEEEDDDDDDTNHDDSQFSAQPTAMPARARDFGIASDRSSSTTTTTTAAATAAAAARNKSPPRTALAAIPDPSRGGGHNGGGGGTTLSTNELLSLFGAAPAPVQQEKASVPLPPLDTTSSHQVSDEARSAESVNKYRVVEDDHFVLPPSSDSSSDEE